MLLGSLILAGGRSRRMGQPKEGLPFGSSTLLGHAVDMLLGRTFPVVVVARDAAQELPPLSLECEVIYDEQVDAGPLAALARGLEYMGGKCDAALVTSCDMPFLSGEAVAWLAAQLGEHQMVVPRWEGVLQPLAAVYRVGVADAVRALLTKGERGLAKVATQVDARILEEKEVRAFDAEGAFLRNLNTVADYEAAQRRQEERRG